jgi:hypothetical protein
LYLGFTPVKFERQQFLMTSLEFRPLRLSQLLNNWAQAKLDRMPQNADKSTVLRQVTDKWMRVEVLSSTNDDKSIYV